MDKTGALAGIRRAYFDYFRSFGIGEQVAKSIQDIGANGLVPEKDALLGDVFHW
jgi:hypothetical protein